LKVAAAVVVVVVVGVVSNLTWGGALVRPRGPKFEAEVREQGRGYWEKALSPLLTS